MSACIVLASLCVPVRAALETDSCVGAVLLLVLGWGLAGAGGGFWVLVLGFSWVRKRKSGLQSCSAVWLSYHLLFCFALAAVTNKKARPAVKTEVQAATTATKVAYTLFKKTKTRLTSKGFVAGI